MRLSAQELELLSQLVAGRSVACIAQRLGLEPPPGVLELKRSATKSWARAFELACSLWQKGGC